MAVTASVNDVLVVGVGGQGVLLCSDILTNVFVRSGFDAKKSEIHGMAQRGGSVESHVRRGERVHSPLIRVGRADLLIALELVEACRYAHWVRPGGIIAAADVRILPSTVGAGLASYPDDPEALLRAVATGPVLIVDSQLAVAAGDARAINTLLLGVASGFIGDVGEEAWDGPVADRVPNKALEINRRAFAAGRELVRGLGAGA